MTAQTTASIAELQQKAQTGDAQAQFDLALCYANSENEEINKELYLNWLTKSAEQGHANAKLELCIYFSTAIFRKSRRKSSLLSSYIWQLSTSLMHDNYDYYELLYDKFDDENISDLAFNWFTKAAEQNSTEAQFFLACCYYDGIGTYLNQELAFEWFKSSAEQNCVVAQFILARCYSEGHGVEQNDQLAFEWFKKSAEQNFSEAQSDLAFCFLEGKGIEQNTAIALEWFTKRANNENDTNNLDTAETCFLLAELYDNCNLIENNKELSVHWREEGEISIYGDFIRDEKMGKIFMVYGKTEEEQTEYRNRKRLELNKAYSKAYFHLAKYYLKYKYVDNNFVIGMEYALKTDEIEHEFAEDWSEDQYELAIRYFEGNGVEKSKENGLKWMIRSAHGNNSDAYNWLTNAFLNLAIPQELLDKFNDSELYKFTFDWCFKKTIGNNCSEANLLLGILYSTGKGVQQNDELAFKCFEKVNITIGSVDEDSEDALTDLYVNLYLSNCYAQGKGVEINASKAKDYLCYCSGDLDHFFGNNFLKGRGGANITQNINVFLTLLRIEIFKFCKKYDLAKEYIEQVFEKAMGVDKSFKEICMASIDQEMERELLYKALHEKEREMLSFFTHTMRNALATAPESLRQAIHLLGSDVYEKDTKHYQAINKIAALFSTLSLTDCLIDTFKQSISDPQEFKLSWRLDHSGDATPRWVIALALKQSLNRIIFMSDTTELKKLLNSQETALVKATRKSFIDDVLPLNVDHQGVDTFYEWSQNHVPTIEVITSNSDKLSFGVNQIRFSLLFAITSELILNALKYWDGENHIHISWVLNEQNNYVFSVKNHCKANAASNLAGTHKGLAFIKRLVELLGEHAQFICKTEDQLFSAELILNKSLFDEDS